MPATQKVVPGGADEVVDVVLIVVDVDLVVLVGTGAAVEEAIGDPSELYVQAVGGQYPWLHVKLQRPE